MSDLLDHEAFRAQVGAISQTAVRKVLPELVRHRRAVTALFRPGIS